MSGIEPEAPAESSSLAAGATPASLLDGSQVHHITDVNGKSRIDEFEVRDLPKGGKKILLAYDKTEDAELAFTHVLNKIASERDHVFLTTILPISAYEASLVYEASFYNSGEDKRYLHEMNKVAMAKLQEKGRQLEEETNCSCTLHVAHGDTRFSLVALAKAHDVDLVVLGRRHLSRFQKIISTGSVSQFVLNHLDRSVLIVKA